MAQLKLTNGDLAAALVGMEFERDRLGGKILEIRQMLDGGRSQPASATETSRPRKKRSLAVRRRMKIAQQLRWQRIKATAAPQESKAAKPKKRKLSAAGKAAIVAALKKRWAAIKAAKQARPAAAKKGGRKKGAAKEAA